MSRQSEDEQSANDGQPQHVTTQTDGLYRRSQTLRQLATSCRLRRTLQTQNPAGRARLKEGESERWHPTARSRQTLRGSLVLAAAGTKVTLGVAFTPTEDDEDFNWRSDF